VIFRCLGCLGSCTLLSLDDSSTCTLDRALSSIGTDGSVLTISRGKQWRARDQLWTTCYAGQGSTVADGGEPGSGSTVAKGSRGVASHCMGTRNLFLVTLCDNITLARMHVPRGAANVTHLRSRFVQLSVRGKEPCTASHCGQQRNAGSVRCRGGESIVRTREQ